MCATAVNTGYKINFSKLGLTTSTYPPSIRWSYADALINLLSGFTVLSQGEYSIYCGLGEYTNS